MLVTYVFFNTENTLNKGLEIVSKMVKNNLTLLLLFFIGIAIQAQESKLLLSGKIVDSNNRPVANANIIVDNKHESYSEEDGSFVIKVSSGKHKINITCLAYKDLETFVDLKNNTLQDFTLTPNAHDLSAVVVVGKSKIQTLRESNYSVNAIDIRGVANQLNSLSSIVGRSSGIKIREDGGVGSDFELSINGLSGNAVRYFINGVPLSTMGSEVSLTNLPVNLVDRVEIYKGFVPADLGTDALGGVVNIITKENISNYIDASYSFGSFNTHRGEFNAQFVDKKTGIIVRPQFGINYSDNDYKMRGVEVWDTTSEEFVFKNLKRFHDKYYSLIGQMQLGVTNKRWADSFFATASYSTMSKDLQTGTIQSIVYGKAKRENDAYKIALNYQKSNLLVEGLSADFSFSHTWDHGLTIDTAYRKYKWDGTYIETSRNEIRGRGKSKMHTKRPATVIRTNFNYLLSQNHTLNLNYLFNRVGNDRYDDINTEFVPSNDALTKQIIGLSYTQNWWKNRLTNVFFIKDYINQLKIEQEDFYWITGVNDLPKKSTKNHIGYGVGSRFHIANFLSAKVSYEYAVRLPLAREMLGNGDTVYPNLKLNPEKGNNVNVGFFGNMIFGQDHRFNYELGFFYRKIEDYIRFNSSDGGAGISQYENIDNVTIKGVEGEVRYSYKNLLQLTANTSYLDEKDKTKYQANGQPSVKYNNQVPNKPWLFSNVELNLQKQNIFGVKQNQLRLSYHLQYVHWYYFTWKNLGDNNLKSRIPTQVINNASITYSLENEKYNLSLECTNLMDRLVYDNHKLQKPGRAFFCKFRLFIN